MRNTQGRLSKAAQRSRRGPSWVGVTVSVFLAAATLTAASWFAPGAADVARADTTSGAQKVGVFEDVTIAEGQTWDNVVVVGGDVAVLGTVKNTVVVVGGDVLIGPKAQVGIGDDPGDTTIVVVFGDVTVEPGASVYGETVDTGGWFSSGTDTFNFSRALGGWDVGSVGGWIWFAVFLAVVAVIIGAIAPRQVVVTSERVRHRFFSSFGWGVLGVIVAALVAVLLIVTIFGLLVLVPWLLLMAAIYLFGFVSIGAALGRLILGRRGDHRGSLMLAAVLGVVIVSVVWWIPVAGDIILFLLGVVGFGATCASVRHWRRGTEQPEQTAASIVSAATCAPVAPIPPAVTYAPAEPASAAWTSGASASPGSEAPVVDATPPGSVESSVVEIGEGEIGQSGAGEGDAGYQEPSTS